MIIWRAPQLSRQIESKSELATMAAARQVAADARILCPVRSGTLKASIRVVKSKFEDGGALVVAGGQGKWGDAFYSHFVELGTPGTVARRRTARGRRRVAREPVAAKPFLRPALKMNKASIQRKFKDFI